MCLQNRFRSLLVGFSLVTSPLLALNAQVAIKSPLTGTITNGEGAPMSGVAVSARAEGQTFTTSVYTDAHGRYAFPEIAPGTYHMRAQAVGFVGQTAEAVVGARPAPHNFTLRPLRDFHRQLSATEWMNALPADTLADRRMNRILFQTCDGACHNINFPLAKRFDADGWEIMIDAMMNYEIVRPQSLTGQEVGAYKDQLIQYLTKIRGPEPFPLHFKALPRIAGEGANVIVTAYTVPRGDTPDLYPETHDGSDWSEGAPSNYLKNVTHDVVPGKDGFVYFTDPQSPERTIGRLDPKTGKVTNFVYRDKNGNATWTHGLCVDQNGDIFAVAEEDVGKIGTILKFDPTTEKFTYFPKPASMTPGIGGMVVPDSQGNLWATQPNGAFHLDPKTGEYTEYDSITPKGTPYGIMMDSEDNPWWSQNEADVLGYVDTKTGKVGQVIMPEADLKQIQAELTAKDRAVVASGRQINGLPPAFQNGGKRPCGDPDGDSLWLGEIFKGVLAKVDIQTKKVVAEYKLPDGEYSYPYNCKVDKNHMVWIALEAEERIARFDPFTEKFTEYPIPLLGSEFRYISMDTTAKNPTFWLSGFAIDKIVRIEVLDDSWGTPGSKTAPKTTAQRIN